MNKEYIVKYINYNELVNEENYDGFAGRIDIEKPNKQTFTNNELDRLEECFENLPVSVTANNTGVSLWLFDKDYTDEILETVKTELKK